MAAARRRRLDSRTFIAGLAAKGRRKSFRPRPILGTAPLHIRDDSLDLVTRHAPLLRLKQDQACVGQQQVCQRKMADVVDGFDLSGAVVTKRELQPVADASSCSTSRVWAISRPPSACSWLLRAARAGVRQPSDCWNRLRPSCGEIIADARERLSRIWRAADTTGFVVDPHF